MIDGNLDGGVQDVGGQDVGGHDNGGQDGDGDGDLCESLTALHTAGNVLSTERAIIIPPMTY